MNCTTKVSRFISLVAALVCHIIHKLFLVYIYAACYLYLTKCVLPLVDLLAV